MSLSQGKPHVKKGILKINNKIRPDRYCLFEKLGFSVYHCIKKDVCVKYLFKNIFRVWR